MKHALDQFGGGLSCVAVPASGSSAPMRFAALPRLAAYTRRIFRQKGFARAAKFAARSMMHRRAARDWLAFMDRHPVLSSAPGEVRAALADKIYRPFARHDLAVAGRAALLQNHYLALARVLPPPALARLVSGEEIPLVRMSGRRTGENYSLHLGRYPGLSHHGELSLLLLDADDRTLAQLTVNCTRDAAGRTVLLLCGLKGRFAGKEKVVRATRDLSGLRPKRAAVEAAYALARFIKAERIIAAAEANLVSQAKRKWRAKVFAEYDRFWVEFSPTPLANGDFELPLAPPRRNLEDVPAKKRNDWRRRGAHLDAISAGVAQALAGLAGG